MLSITIHKNHDLSDDMCSFKLCPKWLSFWLMKLFRFLLITLRIISQFNKCDIVLILCVNTHKNKNYDIFTINESWYQVTSMLINVSTELANKWFNFPYSEHGLVPVPVLHFMTKSNTAAPGSILLSFTNFSWSNKMRIMWNKSAYQHTT